MRFRVRTTLALGLFLGAAFPWSTPLPACAASGSHAALIVDAGDEGETYRLCVRLPGGSTSGIELIQLAGEQHGLAYELGNGGQTVCMLAGVGSSDGNECFGEYPDFWGYWRGSGDGWEWSGTGAASTVVEPGDVEGWSWGRGQDGSTHPAPPPTRVEDVCAVTSEASDDRERPDRSDRGSAAERTTGSGPDPAPTGRPARGGKSEASAPREEPADAGREPAGERARTRAARGKTPVHTPPAEGSGEEADEALAAVASEDLSDDGSPVGPIAATALAAVLFGAGLVTARSRSRRNV